MIPLYILGFLLRYGPQHGYQIKKRMSEQMADFTNIKLPTIYYHLEKMERDGLISAEELREGLRPEKRVYQITPEGKERFLSLLRQTLELEYRPTFAVDGALFFSEYVEVGDLVSALECHAANLREALERLRTHKVQTLGSIPEGMRMAAELIFTHHELHYQAELDWAERAVTNMEGRKE